MRTGVLVSILLAAAAMLSAGCDRELSPSNLKLKLHSSRVTYTPEDDFSGKLTLINRSPRRIRVRFPTGCQYHVAFYDSLGIVRSSFPNVVIQAVTYLELEPLGARVDTLKFPLSEYPGTIPEGAYRVRAWVMGHEDIDSETTVLVSHI